MMTDTEAARGDEAGRGELTHATTALAEALWVARLLPVIRCNTSASLHIALQHCLAWHSPIIELTTTTPDWSPVLREVADDPLFAGVLLGVGTVTTTEQAEIAITTGARFLVSPYPAPAVAEMSGTVPLIQGGYSPAELAHVAGQGIAKLFPAHSLGTDYLNNVLDVLPTANIVPTGGIALPDIQAWLDAGALAVGIGGGLLQTPPEEITTTLANVRPRPPMPSQPPAIT